MIFLKNIVQTNVTNNHQHYCSGLFWAKQDKARQDKARHHIASVRLDKKGVPLFWKILYLLHLSMIENGHRFYIIWKQFSMINVNTLRSRQHGCHFADNTFKSIFLNENVIILIKISLKFVPKGLINNIPALVQIMAWRRPGDKPLSEAMMVSLLMHICVTRPQWVNQGVVSLTFRELSKIILRKYTILEITFMVRISSWNFVCVLKAMLWAHVRSFSLKFS